MAELNEHDLDRLFRAAGHHQPAADLTTRIMARVAVTPVFRPTGVKPLIGPWGWGTILLGVAALLGLLWRAAPATGSSPTPVSDMLRPILDSLTLPAGNWPLWLAGASTCLLLFTLLDRLLAQRLGEE